MKWTKRCKIDPALANAVRAAAHLAMENRQNVNARYAKPENSAAESLAAEAALEYE